MKQIMNHSVYTTEGLISQASKLGYRDSGLCQNSMQVSLGFSVEDSNATFEESYICIYEDGLMEIVRNGN